MVNIGSILWTDHGGDLAGVFDRDRLLDNLSVYWFTGTIGSSFRLYHETNFRAPLNHAKVDVPTEIAHFAGQPFSWPRSLVEWNYRNIQDWQELPHGGHFAALQRPGDFLKAVRGFFRSQAL